MNVMHAFTINSFPRKIKIDLLKGYFKCKWYGLIKKQGEVSAKIGPYTYKSPNAPYFKSLLIEIMIKEEYYIDLKTNTPLIIDCGANIGFTVLYFKLKYPNAKIIAIEANKDTYDILADNVRQLSDVTTYNCFVSNVSDSSVDFYTSGAGDVNASLVADRGGVLNVVKTMSLSSIIAGKHVDVLKMDIEGGEFAIFNERENLDYLANVDNILMEYHHFTEKGRPTHSFAKFSELFENKQFASSVSTPVNLPVGDDRTIVGTDHCYFIRMKKYA